LPLPVNNICLPTREDALKCSISSGLRLSLSAQPMIFAFLRKSFIFIWNLHLKPIWNSREDAYHLETSYSTPRPDDDLSELQVEYSSQKAYRNQNSLEQYSMHITMFYTISKYSARRTGFLPQ
jgi:hypothetical protein